MFLKYNLPIAQRILITVTISLVANWLLHLLTPPYYLSFKESLICIMVSIYLLLGIANVYNRNWRLSLAKRFSNFFSRVLFSAIFVLIFLGLSKVKDTADQIIYVLLVLSVLFSIVAFFVNLFNRELGVRTKDEEKLYVETKKYLLENWLPNIVVEDANQICKSIDSYMPDIIKLLLTTKKTNKISKHIKLIAKINLGENISYDKCKKISNGLVELRDKIMG